MNWIKQYGLYRSGTNYLQWLLTKNFKDTAVLVNECGFKHGPATEEVNWEEPIRDADPPMTLAEKFGPLLPDLQDAYAAKRVRFVFCIKNPYSWIVSFANYASHRRRVVEPPDIELWNHLNGQWLAFQRQNPKRCQFVRYEDLIASWETVVDHLHYAFGLPAAGPRYINAMGKMNRGGGQTREGFDPSYYKNKGYLEQISPGKLAAINNRIDPELMRAFRYEREG